MRLTDPEVYLKLKPNYMKRWQQEGDLIYQVGSRAVVGPGFPVRGSANLHVPTFAGWRGNRANYPSMRIIGAYFTLRFYQW